MKQPPLLTQIGKWRTAQPRPGLLRCSRMAVWTRATKSGVIHWKLRMRLLTPIQNAAVLSAQTRWLGWIFSTEPANREQAEEAVRQTYRAGGVPEPEIFL